MGRRGAGQQGGVQCPTQRVGIRPCCPHLLVDVDGLLVLLQLGGVCSHFQQTFVSRAETKNQGRVTVPEKNDKTPQRTFTRSSARDPREKAEVCLSHTSQNYQTLSSHITKLSDPFITCHTTVRTFHQTSQIRTFHHMTQIYQTLSSHVINLSETFLTHHKTIRTFHHISQNCKKNNTCLLDSSPL